MPSGRKKLMKGGIYDVETLAKLVNRDGYIKDINQFEIDPKTYVLAEDPITLEPIKYKEAIVLDGQVYSALSLYELLVKCQSQEVPCIVPHSRRPIDVFKLKDAVYPILKHTLHDRDVHFYGIMEVNISKPYLSRHSINRITYYKKMGNQLFAKKFILEPTQVNAQKHFAEIVDTFVNKNEDGKLALVMMDLLTKDKFYNDNIQPGDIRRVENLTFHIGSFDTVFDRYDFLVSENVYQDFPMLFQQDNSMYEAAIGAYMGGTKINYKGKMYKVRLGPKGGQYITVGKDKKKVYVS